MQKKLYNILFKRKHAPLLENWANCLVVATFTSIIEPVSWTTKVWLCGDRHHVITM